MRLTARRCLLASSCSRVVSISETPDPLFSYSSICGCLPHRLARRFYYLLQGHDTICVSRSSWKHHEKRNMNSSCSIWWLHDFTQALKSKFTLLIFVFISVLFPCFFSRYLAASVQTKPQASHLFRFDFGIKFEIYFTLCKLDCSRGLVDLHSDGTAQESVCVFFLNFSFFSAGFWQIQDPRGELLIWLLSREGQVFVKMYFFQGDLPFWTWQSLFGDIQ